MRAIGGTIRTSSTKSATELYLSVNVTSKFVAVVCVRTEQMRDIVARSKRQACQIVPPDAPVMVRISSAENVRQAPACCNAGLPARLKIAGTRTRAGRRIMCNRAPSALRRDQVDESGVDVLTAAGLATVNREHVSAGTQRGAALGRQHRQLVVRRVPTDLQRQDTVDVDLGVLVMVEEQLRIPSREARGKIERPADPDVRRVPQCAHDGPRSI